MRVLFGVPLMDLCRGWFAEHILSDSFDLAAVVAKTVVIFIEKIPIPVYLIMKTKIVNQLCEVLL